MCVYRCVCVYIYIKKVYTNEHGINASTIYLFNGICFENLMVILSTKTFQLFHSFLKIISLCSVYDLVLFHIRGKEAVRET